MKLIEKLRHKSILFLEDNEEFARNTTALLEVFVETVHCAATIEEARGLLKNEAVDIVISDIRLRQENGLDFIHEIRATNATIPIIVLSGHKDEEFLFRSIPLGLSAYLLKPIKYDDLIDALGRCAERIGLMSQHLIDLKEGWMFDTRTRVLVRENKEYPLDKKAARFVEMLALNRERLITKEMFQLVVWQEDEMSDSALTNFILRIRRRFGKEFIYTIPDLGYRFKL